VRLVVRLLCLRRFGLLVLDRGGLQPLLGRPELFCRQADDFGRRKTAVPGVRFRLALCLVFYRLARFAGIACGRRIFRASRRRRFCRIMRIQRLGRTALAWLRPRILRQRRRRFLGRINRLGRVPQAAQTIGK
jgi:hypothetical protein